MFLALVAVFLVGCEVGEESYYYNSSTGTETGTEAGAGGDDTNTGSYGDDTDCLAEFPTLEKAFPGFKDVFQGADFYEVRKHIDYTYVTNLDEYIDNLLPKGFESDFTDSYTKSYSDPDEYILYSYFYKNINYAGTNFQTLDEGGVYIQMLVGDNGVYDSNWRAHSSSYIEDSVFDAIFPEIKGCKSNAYFQAIVYGDYSTQLDNYRVSQGFTPDVLFGVPDTFSRWDDHFWYGIKFIPDYIGNTPMTSFVYEIARTGF
jgi:hypothetical protein